MDEESVHFWIIPVICMVAVAGIFGGLLVYQSVLVPPKAEMEYLEIKEMDCENIKEKNSTGAFWNDLNKITALMMIEKCDADEQAIIQAEKDRLEKLLADPNSDESLQRDLKKFQGLYNSFKEQYDFHHGEASILIQNVTEYKTLLDQTEMKLSKEYGDR